MKSITINLYTFDELSDEGKQKAYEKNRIEEYFYIDEGLKSIEEALGHFGSRATDWSMSPYSPSFIDIKKVDEPEDVLEYVKAELTELKAYPEVVETACPFTGYYVDEDFLDPLREYIKNPDADKTLNELLQECANNAMKAIIADMEYQDSMEYFAEHCEANEYTFEADGTMRNA